MDNSKSGEVGLPDNDFFETDVIPHLLKCDIIVFACSIYFFGMNAQLKVVLDRFYLYSNQLRNKKIIVLVTGYGTPKQMQPTKLHFEGISDYLGWKIVGSVYADDSWNEEKFKGFLNDAYQIGKSIK